MNKKSPSINQAKRLTALGHQWKSQHEQIDQGWANYSPWATSGSPTFYPASNGFLQLYS